MKRFVLAAAAALGVLSAGSAGAMPIVEHLTVTGFTNDPVKPFIVSADVAFDPNTFPTTGTAPLTSFSNAFFAYAGQVVGNTPGQAYVRAGPGNEVGYAPGDYTLVLNVSGAAGGSTVFIALTPMGVIATGSRFAAAADVLVGGQLALAEEATVAISPVPEIATWATMMVGFGAIGAAARRRSKARLRFA